MTVYAPANEAIVLVMGRSSAHTQLEECLR